MTTLRPHRRSKGTAAPSTAGLAGQQSGQSDGLSRVIFEQARDSILVLELPPGAVPVIRDANPAALILHGYSREEIIGKPVTVLGASLRSGRLSRLNSGDSAVFEVRQKRKDGTPLVTEVTARNAGFGSALYGILVERDVTRRLELEEEGRLVAGRIMMAREAEKKRLAASLHDTIGAMQVGMSSLLLLLEEDIRAGEKRRAFGKIEQARKLLKKTTSDVKNSCVQSWPPSLAISGLEPVLRELLSEFSRRSDISVQTSISVPSVEAVPKTTLAIVIYRLAREALTNAEKHSGAEKMDFSLSSDSSWVSLSVRDYGRGFNTAKAKDKKNCLGLKIMAETAGAAGGYFSVYSKPGWGTLVKAELPLSPEPAPRS